MTAASSPGGSSGRNPLTADIPMAARTMQQAGLTIHSTGWMEILVTRASRATLRAELTKVLAYKTIT